VVSYSSISRNAIFSSSFKTSSSDADKTERRGYMSVKITKHSAIPFSGIASY